ncbi:u1-type domain-containing protein [Trichonephila clavata]|uniref:U1-type domain-containing protein n=1 Tax=Trichonephila clavata TaxID=2740835 RepID=A0A8X6F4F1_TRICU|nr:u1-type domain-containing protein [Trichonephila clavata]
MSSDRNSSNLPINDQAEKSVPKGFATSKEIICDICKIRVPCKKTLEYHEKGRKHQRLLRRKEKKRNKASIHSTKNPCDSNQLPSFIALSKNCDMPNKKKYNSHCSRNNHSESPNCSNSPNFREPYHRNNRYFGIQDYETDRKSYDKSSWNSKNGKHFSFDRRYNRFNHSFGQPNHLENSHYPNNHAYYLAAPDRSNKHDFSENIQPPEDSGKFGKHPSDNDNSKEIIRISTDEETSPNEKSLNQKVVRRVKLSSENGEEVSLETIVTKESFQKESENEKQLEKSKVLTENMTGKRISHWINPSNHKDKAEVRRLVTEFSKSKKKENLIKLKLQTDQNDKALIQNSSLQNTPEEISEQLHDLPVASEIPANESLESSSNIPLINILETKKRQRSKSLTDISTDSVQASSKNSKETAKKTKKPRRFSTKSSDSNYGKNESLTNSKRKDFVAQSYTSKRHKCSSAECLDQCIDAVVCSEDTSLHLDVLKPVEAIPPIVQAVHNDFPSGNQEFTLKRNLLRH